MAYGRIGVSGAMDSELAALIAALTQPAQETVQGLVFRTGRLGAREVVLVRCGIGKVSAARCTQVLIDRFAPGAVINTGIAGGLASGLAVGDIVVADGLVQHDFDAAPIGFVRGCVCMGDPGAPTVFAPDAVLSALLAQTAGNAIGAQRVHRGLGPPGAHWISPARCPPPRPGWLVAARSRPARARRAAGPPRPGRPGRPVHLRRGGKGRHPPRVPGRHGGGDGGRRGRAGGEHERRAVCRGACDLGSGRRHGRRVVRAVRAARGRGAGRGRFAGARAAGLKAREAAKGSPIRRC